MQGQQQGQGQEQEQGQEQGQGQQQQQQQQQEQLQGSFTSFRMTEWVGHDDGAGGWDGRMG